MDNYIYRIGSPTNIIGRPPNFYRSDELHSKQCRFASVYAVTHEAAQAIQETAKTAQGFKGIVWSSRLWVDFDTEEAGRVAEQKLKESGYDFVVYHTGNRGYHIGIARDAKPSHTLPQQDKAWVSANLPGADLSLYWHLHLIRLPGTIHEKTGKPKTLILRKDGRSLQLPTSQESINIRGIDGTQEHNGRAQSIFSSWEVMSKLQPTCRKDLVELAAAIRSCTDASKEEASWLIKEANKLISPPRDEGEVERLVGWAYEK